jgi:hypothetical protein
MKAPMATDLLFLSHPPFLLADLSTLGMSTEIFYV